MTINTDLNNDWAYLSLALINEDTGVAYDFGKEISYYYGRDSDGSWSEGGRSGKRVPSGSACRSLLPSCRTRDGKGRPRAYVVLRLDRGTRKPVLLLVSGGLSWLC